MANKSKRKGDRAELAEAEWLRQHGWYYADRSLGAGRPADRGDITGIPGVVYQVKHQERIKLAEWMTETLEQQARAQADLGILVIRKKGSPDPGTWYTVLEQRQLNRLMLESDGRWPLEEQPARDATFDDDARAIDRALYGDNDDD